MTIVEYIDTHGETGELIEIAGRKFYRLYIDPATFGPMRRAMFDAQFFLEAVTLATEYRELGGDAGTRLFMGCRGARGNVVVHTKP